MKRARDPDALRVVVAEHPLSQRRIATMIGCSESHLRNALAGEPIAPAYARDLAGILGCSTEWLFEDAVATADVQVCHSRGAA